MRRAVRTGPFRGPHCCHKSLLSRLDCDYVGLLGLAEQLFYDRRMYAGVIRRHDDAVVCSNRSRYRQSDSCIFQRRLIRLAVSSPYCRPRECTLIYAKCGQIGFQSEQNRIKPGGERFLCRRAIQRCVELRA